MHLKHLVLIQKCNSKNTLSLSYGITFLVLIKYTFTAILLLKIKTSSFNIFVKNQNILTFSNSKNCFFQVIYKIFGYKRLNILYLHIPYIDQCSFCI